MFRLMALSAQGKYPEPEFLSITPPVMPVLSLLPAMVAIKLRRWAEMPELYRIVHGIAGFDPVGILGAVLGERLALHRLPRWRPLIRGPTRLALGLKPVLLRRVLAEPFGQNPMLGASESSTSFESNQFHNRKVAHESVGIRKSKPDPPQGGSG